LGGKMEKNIGKMDRMIRFIIGILLFYLAFITDSNLLIIVFTAFATISIYESYIGFCGIYKLFKINTIGSK
jgi:hypothetical protein